MNNDIHALMRSLWQTACVDKPLRPSAKIEDGYFVFTISGNKERWSELIQAAGVPAHAEQQITDNQIVVRWKSLADVIFGPNGLMAQHLPNYEMRLPQLHMARLVQRAIEMNEPAVIEAGTGVGKSFAYAAICMAMDKRLVISTSNKALQMQLYKKDIPFLARIFPGKRIALAQGKGNYVCRYKAEDQVSGYLRIESPQLRSWYAKTIHGNTEEIPFAVNWKELAAITADDNCLGTMCPRYAECYYYIDKEQRQQADIVITNHMLLAMHRLYPGANILPEADVIVVDEAHKLADYARNALGMEFSINSIRKALDILDEYGLNSTDADSAFIAFQGDLNRFLWSKSESQVGIRREQTIRPGIHLAELLYELADEIFPSDIPPSNTEEKRDANQANRLRSLADKITVMSNPTKDGFVRFVDQGNKDNIRFHNVPYDVSEFIGGLAGFHPHKKQEQEFDHTRCHRCGRKLTATVVNVLEGKPYGPDCIRKVDIFGDAEPINLSDWLAMEHPPTPKITIKSTPVIFTSATLAAPTLNHFMRDCGLEHALQMQAESPFNYEDNALLFVPKGAAPSPRDKEFQDFMVQTMKNLIVYSQGGAFLLFTSYANMNYAVENLRPILENWDYQVMVQGELPKLEIAQRFRETTKAVLFATKSFFEGVSIDGHALRLVVIDKMPFEAPNPLNQAQEEAMRTYARKVLGYPPKKAEWYPFEALRVPKMIIELKQGVGRLIRTSSDYGVIAILDPRLRTSRYGRNMVLPALPPAPVTSRMEAVDDFFHKRRQIPMPTVSIRTSSMQAPAFTIETEEDRALWNGAPTVNEQ